MVGSGSGETPEGLETGLVGYPVCLQSPLAAWSEAWVMDAGVSGWFFGYKCQRLCHFSLPCPGPAQLPDGSRQVCMCVFEGLCVLGTQAWQRGGGRV